MAEISTEVTGTNGKDDKGKRPAQSPLALMQRLCSMREYCVQDIRTKLRAKGCDEKEITLLLQRLIEEKFLSEERYAKAFARDKSSLSGWGGKKIEYALRNKGVAPDVIKGALGALDPKSEGEILQRVIQRKFKELKSKTGESRDERTKIKERLLRFGLTRGFSYEEILKIINKTMANFEAGKNEYYG